MRTKHLASSTGLIGPASGPLPAHLTSPRIAPLLCIPTAVLLINVAWRPLPLGANFVLLSAAVLSAVLSWTSAAWLTFASLMILSYGAASAALPGPLSAVPIALLVVAACTAKLHHVWGPTFAQWAPRWMRYAFAATLGWTAFRLAIDFPTYGALAVRDAIFILAYAAIPLGIACAVTMGRTATENAIDRCLLLASAWYVLYPFEERIHALSPTVGLSDPVPLLSFVAIGWVPLWSLMRFVNRSGTIARVGSLSALLGILLSQFRFAYIGTAIGLLLLKTLGRSTNAHLQESQPKRSASITVRIGLLATAGLIMIPSVVPLSGRFDNVSLTQIGEQLQTLTGGEGDGSGSVDMRRQWWEATWSELTTNPVRLAGGVGLGPDLTGGFTSRTGASVRKPHNDYLEYFARLGVIGFAPYLAFIGGVTTRLIRRRHNETQTWISVVWLLFLAMAATQPFMSLIFASVPAYFLVGIAIGMDRYDGEARPRQSVGQPLAS